MFPYDLVDGRRTPGLHGRFTVREAVQRLIANQPLVIASVSPSMIALKARPVDDGGPVSVQDDAPAPSEAQQDIVVTGLRRSNEAAIISKQRATNITDVVSATEARALPDNTIVEALRRIPGLTVLPATDNEHPRDEASAPVIRGLGPSYNNVTIDGLQMASPGTPNGNLGSVGRGVRLDILPSSMISEIQVVKTFTPDLDPNAVGGAINLRTRSAFENGGKPFFTMEGSLGHSSDNGEPTPQDDPGYRVTATGSTTFGSEHQFGAVLSANWQTLSSYTETHMTTDSGFYNFYDNSGNRLSGTNIGNGYAVPQQDKYWYVQDKRDRYGITGKLEARITDRLSAYALGGYYMFRDDMTRNEDLIDPRSAAATVQNQTPTSGSFAGGGVEVGYSNQKIDTRSRVAQAGLDWQTGDHQHLTLRGSWSYATYREPIYMIKFTTGATYAAPGTSGANVATLPAFGFTYDTSKLNQSFNVSPEIYNDLNNYTLSYWRPDYERTAQDTVAMARADYAYKQDYDDRGVGFAAGATYTADTPGYNVYRNEYQLNNTAPAFTLADVAAASAPLKWSNNGLGLLTIDPAKARGLLESLPASAFNQTNQVGFSSQDNFSHRENLFGAYALASFQSDAVSARAGVRLDNTDQSTTGALQVNGVYQPVVTSSSYRYLLPSALVTWHATDHFDLRSAFSQTIGRPTYESYAARSAINFQNPSDEGNPNALGVSVSLGNPDIKPRRSDNYDISAEYRLGGGFDGFLSVAGFVKNIHDEIFTLVSTGYTWDGVTYATASVSQPANASSAGIKGLEFNAILNSLRPLSAHLAHFGVSSNAALMSSHIDVATPANVTRRLDHLIGQSNYVVNAAAFYNYGGFELRAAYNRQGKALRSVVTDIASQDLYWAPRSQVDVSATYAVNRQASLIAQVSNVTHERITSLTGPNQNLLKDSYSVPTIFWLGVRFTPHF